MNLAQMVPGSFRDPTAFVVKTGDRIVRYLTPAYRQEYAQLMNSGLYEKLVADDLLIRHEELESEERHIVIQPEMVPFISYPYEWCFSQLKDAALTTLRILRQAINHGMILKDASAYNIQFLRGKPLLIDTSSFEHYEEGQPWFAYAQFCRHFLAPLALMSYKDVRLGRLLQLYLDGVPLDLAAKLLPLKARLNCGIAYHLLLHAGVEAQASGIDDQKALCRLKRKVDRLSKAGSNNCADSGFTRDMFVMQTENLIDVIEDLELPVQSSEWSSYYVDNSYSEAAFENKEALVSEFLDPVQPRVVFDLGANTGLFSEIAAAKNSLVVALDVDANSVEANYRRCKSRGQSRILPLLSDLANPSPAIGFGLQERQSLLDRGPADAALALALIHHLCIGNNVPLDLCAKFMGELSKALIIEFVPKEDTQVKRLLAIRQDVFPGYHEAGFEKAFGNVFGIERKQRIADSDRTLYLMRKR